MSLPTPPRSSHSSNKENRENNLASRGVAWAQHNQIHTLSFSPPSKQLRTPTSASRDRPARSILKKQSLTSFGPLPQDICDDFIKPREVTPEPEDPLCNVKYLEHPVSRITSSVSSGVRLHDLIEAYNVLAARLRSSIMGSKGESDTDVSWPLFLPIKKNKDAFVKAVVRDLGRALVDPLADDSCGEWGEKKENRILVPLPSPNNTPMKKKDGMTAEQAKYARDLCTISHSVIRLLNVVWTIPAVRGIFSHEEHGEMLAQVLAIPLEPELPTINARKTCALAVWLIQTQRLPKGVLAPAADKIVAALKRAIDGELGKEGKKGSVSDGLKAVHDLCVYQPTVFVKSSAPILPTILQNLLAPTLVLRVQACQALGGVVSGANKAINRKGYIHARFARLVRFFLTRGQNKSKEMDSKDQSAHNGSTALSAPSTPKEPTIIRTLRITLEATDPQHSAQGPVWALNVLANLITLLGPVLIEDHALRRTLTSLLTLGLRHPKSSVRALACIVWRPLVWVYFQPVFQFDIIGEDEADSLERLEGDESLTEEEREERKKTRKEEREKTREKEVREGRKALWKLLTSVVECQTGVMTVAALLASAESSSDDEEDRVERKRDADDAIRRVLSLLKLMILKGGQNCGDAVEIARRLVRFEQNSSPSSLSPSSSDSDSEIQLTWHMNMLLPRSLFSATSNLLVVEFKNLSTAVRAIMERSAGLEVVRALTREELSKEWVFNGLIGVWKEAVGCLEMYDGDETPTDISEVWDGLMKANVGHLQESGDDAATIAFTTRAADILIDIIQDRNIDLTPKVTVSPSSVPAPKAEIEVLPVTFSSDPPQEDMEPTKRFTNGALKLRVARDLWATVRTVVPHALLGPASEKLQLCLVKNEDELLGGGDVLDYGEAEKDENALKLWAQLCAELAMCYDIGVVRSFWCCERGNEFRWSQGPFRMAVWGVFTEVWKAEANCTWESSAVLLCVPFVDAKTESTAVDDLSTWETLLDNTIAKALDHGYSSSTVLEEVASSLLQTWDWEDSPCTPSLIRATDMLLSRLDTNSGTGHAPLSLFLLVNDVLITAYPPSSQVKQYARWVLRTLSDIMRKCDRDENENLQSEVQAEVVNRIATTVKRGVSLWLMDEKKVMDEEEWAYDLEPLYGYLMSALSLLPKELDTLRDHGVILQSALLGNEFRTQLAADAFTDFWAGYSNAVEPQEGWPEGLVRCLGTAGLCVAAKAFKAGEDGAEQGEDLPPSSPLIPASPSDDEEQDTDSDTPSLLCTPSRRAKRPIKYMTSPSIFPRLRLPAPSPSSPTCPAMEAKILGGRKRRRISAEDGRSLTKDVPSPPVPNVVPPCSSPSTPSKRKSNGGLDLYGSDLPSPSKRTKSTASGIQDAGDVEDEDLVACSLLVSPTTKHRIGCLSKRRRRVRMIMEAVEVPTVKEVTNKYRLGLSLRTQSTDSVEGSEMHRARADKARADGEQSLLLKRKRRHSAESDDGDLFGPSPLPSLIASCKRSVTMPIVRASLGTSFVASTPTPTQTYSSVELNDERITFDTGPPSSPSPQRRLVLEALLGDSDNEDDQSGQGSSPIRAVMLRRSLRTKCQEGGS